MSDGAKDIIRKCLEKDPKARAAEMGNSPTQNTQETPVHSLPPSTAASSRLSPPLYPPQKRITAEQALRHEWVREGGAPDRELDPEVLVRMRTFAGQARLKKLGLMLVVRHLRTEEIEGLRQLFLDMDTDGSGTITVDELISGLDRHGAHMAREEVVALIRVRVWVVSFLPPTNHFSSAP